MDNPRYVNLTRETMRDGKRTVRRLRLWRRGKYSAVAMVAVETGKPYPQAVGRIVTVEARWWGWGADAR